MFNPFAERGAQLPIRSNSNPNSKPQPHRSRTVTVATPSSSAASNSSSSLYLSAASIDMDHGDMPTEKQTIRKKYSTLSQSRDSDPYDYSPKTSHGHNGSMHASSVANASSYRKPTVTTTYALKRPRSMSLELASASAPPRGFDDFGEPSCERESLSSSSPSLLLSPKLAPEPWSIHLACIIVDAMAQTGQAIKRFGSDFYNPNHIEKRQHRRSDAILKR